MSLPANHAQVQAGQVMLDSPHRMPSRSPCQPSCSGRQTAALTKCRAALTSTEIPKSKVPGTSFIRPHLLDMEPYTPILPFEILSKQMGMDPHDIVKLDANENPYGPPPEVGEALGKMQFPNIYPDPETRRLRTALAEVNDIPMEHLLVSLDRIAIWVEYAAITLFSRQLVYCTLLLYGTVTGTVAITMLLFTLCAILSPRLVVGQTS